MPISCNGWDVLEASTRFYVAMLETSSLLLAQFYPHWQPVFAISFLPVKPCWLV